MYHGTSQPPQHNYGNNNNTSPLQQQQQQNYYHAHSPTISQTVLASTPTASTSMTPASTTRQRTPLATPMSSVVATPSSSTTRMSTPQEQVERAKEQWSNHGDGISQASEERRRKLCQHGHVVVRITCAVSRIDATGKPYTAYIISYRTKGQHEQEQTSQNVIEHRYSEFRQLNDFLISNRISLKTTFPTKHYNWMSFKNTSGLGQWIPKTNIHTTTNNNNGTGTTPMSAMVSPNNNNNIQEEKLIAYRKTQLDLWLLELCEMYNSGQLPPIVHAHVWDFFTKMNRPPCDIEEETTNMDIKHNMSILAKSNPIPFSLNTSIRQATCMFQNMSHEIPLGLLRHAKALCFLTVAKAGFVMSGRIGTGLIVAAKQQSPSQQQQQQQQHYYPSFQTPTTSYWSAPSALGTLGIGYGALAGGDITNYIIVLTTTQAVSSFCQPSSIRLGAEVGIALGPSSLTPQALSTHQKNWTLHSAYCYGQSKAGLFVGVSLEGSLISPRHDVNAKFYNRHDISPQELLLGTTVPPPKACQPLYNVLNQIIL